MQLQLDPAGRILADLCDSRRRVVVNFVARYELHVIRDHILDDEHVTAIGIVFLGYERTMPFDGFPNVRKPDLCQLC
ncbi:hypothetical protein Brsp07_03463 [Brucella sp. NBRC 14130]